MPAVLLILSRLGALIALIGSAPGVHRWKRLSRGQRWTTAYLWASGILGVLAWILRRYHMANPIVGNLWDLANVAVLFPAMIHGIDFKFQEAFKPIQVISVVAWLVWFVTFGHIDQFTTGFHFAACMVLLAASGGIFYRFMAWQKGYWKSPAFILALGAAIGFLSDVAPFAASHDWLALNQGPQRALWAFRNGAWCVAYLLMAVSVYRVETERRKRPR